MKKIYILILLIFISEIAHCQYDIINNNGQIITTCNATFSDNTSGNYTPNLNNIITFKAGTPNTGLKIIFSQFDIHPTDTLFVYEGANTSSPLIGKYNNSNPFIIGQNQIQSSIFNITNSTGASLTFKFVSDGSNQANGWIANVSCTPICQKIIPKLDTLQTFPHPDQNNNMNACLGQSITLSGGGLFPENYILYNQNSYLNTYDWDFGDGTTATGQTVNHTYSSLSGYEILLKITDSVGCESSFTRITKLRLASNPINKINPLNTMCINETQLLKVGLNPNSNVVIEPISFYNKTKIGFDSIMFIPDGPNCPTQVYSSTLLVNSFPLGAIIKNASDLTAICINTEHSFTGDLGIKIICPNNQFVQLDANTHSGGNFLGIPAGGSNHHAYDNGCLQVNNLAGIGWNYCWSEFYPNNNMTLDQLSSSSGPGTIMVNGSRTIDSTNQSNQTNYIKPQNPFNSLVGCPFNGIWSLEIIDDFGSDNGYIFHWDLQLQNNTSMVNWNYYVNIDTVKITGPYATSISDTSSLINHPPAGNYNYQIYIKDEFGCAWDTTLSLKVMPIPIVNLGSDTTVCSGNFTLNAGNPGASYLWTTPTGIQTTQSIITDNLFSPMPFSFNYSVIVTYLTNSFSCSAYDTIIITTNPKPDISFIIETHNANGCDPFEIQFINVTEPYNSTYLWNFGDGSISTLLDPSHTYHAGVYDIGLTATTAEGCTNTVTIPNLITAYPRPYAEFISNPVFALANNEITFINLSSNSDNTHFWDFGDGVISQSANPKHIFDNLGIYEITHIETSVYGCTDSITHSFSVINPGIIMDNLNNKLYISNVTTNSTISIYDMGGKCVYTRKADDAVIINVSLYVKGIYIVRVSNESNTVTGKFYKE